MTANPWEFWSAEQIASATGVLPAAINEHWPKIVAQMDLCEIVDRPVQAGMIGTVAIETASTFKPIHEFPDWARYPRSGGYPPHYEGGHIYHGRGYIQVTHRSNYEEYGRKVADLWGTSPDQPDFDLVRHPDNALNPDVSAAIASLYFRDTATIQGYKLTDACRAGDWEWVRRLVQGGTAALTRLVQITTALGAATPPPPVKPIYDPEHAAHIQEETFDCSQESLEWAFWAYGRTTSDDWLEGTMMRENVMTSNLGLMDWTGKGLAAFVRRHYAELGYLCENEAPVSFESLVAESGRYPILIGGRNWGHWSGLRRAEKNKLLLANPAPGHMEVWQEMTKAQFDRLGEFAMVRVRHETTPPYVPDEPVEEIAALKERIAGLEIALAHVCDVESGDKLLAITETTKGIREEFLGPRA